MAHLLTNYPPKPKKVNSFGSECPQLKIPVEIEYYNQPTAWGLCLQYWFGTIMQVSFKFVPHIHHANDSNRVVAVWKLKRMKPATGFNKDKFE